MNEEEIPDYNIFMMCEKLNENALTGLDKDYYFRNCRRDELDVWKAFPFDSHTIPPEYEDFMNRFIKETYSSNMNLFFQNTVFVCDKNDTPIATCSYWKAYGKINTIHWLKTLKAWEGKGIGRAVLSEIMKRFTSTDYPVYVHTQPGSYRAIKLYADFGFSLLKGGQFGARENDLEKCLPILREFMNRDDFEKLKIIDSPDQVLRDLAGETTIQF